MHDHQLLPSIVRSIEKLKPGEALTVGHMDDNWSQVDRIMENVIGSSYIIRVIRNYATRDVTFERLTYPLDDGRLTYVSPDRRHFYRPEGFFWRWKD